MKFHKTIAFDAKSVFAILENNPFFKGTAIIAWSHIRIRMGAVVPHRPIDTAFMRTIPGVLAGIEEHWVPTADHTEVAIKTLHPSRNNGHKRTIMMVPALLTNSVTLEPLALQFVSRGYKVCLLDLRNHKVANGVCPKTYDRGWTFDDYIKFDMPAGLDFVSKTYQQKVVLVGHSMGGMVARFFTALNPELSETVIDRVVAIASPSLVRTEFNFWGSGALKFGLGFVPKTAINLGLSITEKVLPKIIQNLAIARLSASIYHHTPINLSVARHFPPLKDALGYEEMSALEFHKTMTCMLGNEHLKVAIQFMRSELNADDFMSFDQTINYTQEERQLSVPIFYMIGKTDSLTPRKVTLHNLFNIKSKEKWVAEFDQGHTGIVLHPPTAAKIAELTDGWISGAMRHPAKSLNTHAVAGIL